MAEIQYYGTDEEAISLALFFVGSLDASIHVDDSPTSTPPVVRKPDQIARLFSLPLLPLLHITSPAWSTLPLSTSEVNTNDGRHFFSIDQRYGGPAFMWSVPRPIRFRGKWVMKLGAFGDWPSYYLSKDSSIAIPRPNEMAEVYQEISRRIRAGAVRSRWKTSGRPGPWVSQEALAKMRDGYQLAAGGNLTVSMRPLTAASTRTRTRATRAGNAGR